MYPLSHQTHTHTQAHIVHASHKANTILYIAAPCQLQMERAIWVPSFLYAHYPGRFLTGFCRSS